MLLQAPTVLLRRQNMLRFAPYRIASLTPKSHVHGCRVLASARPPPVSQDNQALQTASQLTKALVVWSGTVFALALTFLKNPLNFSRRQDRADLPWDFPLPDMTSEFVTVNGVRLFVVRHGKGSGKPLMLFVHGFPESWYTWKYQLKEFAGEYEVAAVNLRGYGPSDIPEGKENYTVDVLVEDLAQLIPALGHDSCTLVGHDWGALLGWTLLERQPQLVDRYIAVTVPPGWKFGETFRNSKEQQRRSTYITAFQLPLVPELITAANDYAALNDAFCTPGLGGVRNPSCRPSPAQLEQLKKAVSYPGALTAALNYYRANLSRPVSIERPGLVEKPVLQVWAANDFALCPDLYTKPEEWGTDVTVVKVEDCSHWVPFDRPEELIKSMRAFLARTRVEKMV